MSTWFFSNPSAPVDLEEEIKAETLDVEGGEEMIALAADAAVNHITITLKTADGKTENEMQQIPFDCTVDEFKDIIYDRFLCKPKHQHLIFHGEELENSKRFNTDYEIVNGSCIILKREKTISSKKQKQLLKNNDMFSKSNPFYSNSNSNLNSNHNKNSNHLYPNIGGSNAQNIDINLQKKAENSMVPSQPESYSDPMLSELAQIHPELPSAFIQHSESIAAILHRHQNQMIYDAAQPGSGEPNPNNNNIDGNTDATAAMAAHANDTDTPNGNQHKNNDNSLYLYSMMTFMNSVYTKMPSRKAISKAATSVSEYLPTLPYLQQLLFQNSTNEERKCIQRLMALGYDKRAAIEAFLVCEKNEVSAAMFLAQARTNTNDETMTKGGGDGDGDGGGGGGESDVMFNVDGDESKEQELQNLLAAASNTHMTKGGGIHTNNSINTNNPYFKQFSEWLKLVFADNENLYYKYLFLFMKHEITNLSTDLENLNYNEPYLMSIGFSHPIHRKRVLTEIARFVTLKKQFELWFEQTIQFKKYLQKVYAIGIYSIEDMLLEIRSEDDIRYRLKIENESDIQCIFEHVQCLRENHSLYQNAQTVAQTMIQETGKSENKSSRNSKLSKSKSKRKSESNHSNHNIPSHHSNHRANRNANKNRKQEMRRVREVNAIHHNGNDHDAHRIVPNAPPLEMEGEGGSQSSSQDIYRM